MRSITQEMEGVVAFQVGKHTPNISDIFSCVNIAWPAVQSNAQAGLSICMRRLLTGKPLKPFVPQSTFLSLITTGDRYAIGTKGPFCLEVCPTLSCFAVSSCTTA